MPAGRFVAPELLRSLVVPDGELTLPDEIARQVRDVLRLSAGDEIRLLDGVGGEYPARISQLSRRQVSVILGSREQGLPNPAAHVTLCLGMLKAAKLEWALQKGTELGVAEFRPLVTERSVAGTDEMGGTKRRRYERIIAEALEQCGGSWLPTLHDPTPLAQAVAQAPAQAVALIPWEEAREGSVRETLAQAFASRPDSHREVWLYIGPEGGFSAREVALAQGHGALPVTLGPRILRAETAAIVAAALTLDALSGSREGVRPD